MISGPPEQLVGVFCLDENHAVRAADAVESQTSRILHHFDRRDIVGIDSQEAAARSRLDWLPVDHIEWFGVAIDGSRSANSESDPTVCSSGDRHTRNAGLQGLFDRLRSGAIKVFACDRCAGKSSGRRGIRHVIHRWPRVTNAANGEPDEQYSEQRYARCD